MNNTDCDSALAGAGSLEQEIARFEESLARGDDPSVPYDPFITAVRARSRGYSYRTPGIITGRTHQQIY